MKVQPMNRVLLLAGTALLLPMISACTTEAIKRSAYETVYQKHCVDQTGAPNCNPEHKDYERYKKDREETLKQPR
jgi:hypothetical protein